MEEYTGVKFKTLFEDLDFGHEKERKAIVDELKRLSDRALLEKNNGNVSVRADDGLVITPSGKNMKDVVSEDLVLVKGINEGARIVRAVGRSIPSSESMMHWLIYEDFPGAKAIVHFHEANILKNHDRFVETAAVYPYGTVELAHAAVKALKEKKFIILRDHGPIVIGPSLKACHAMIEKALKSVR